MCTTGVPIWRLIAELFPAVTTYVIWGGLTCCWRGLLISCIISGRDLRGRVESIIILAQECSAGPGVLAEMKRILMAFSFILIFEAIVAVDASVGLL